jgi:2-polyprenyl-6-methoxyphenol hydroxylase-like FAD-dependent oxidoreductase
MAMNGRAGEVAIIGGGIAGLTFGLALAERGIGCTVYERAAGIGALGVGINLLPHAAAELEQLGLGPALRAAAVQTSDAAFFNRFGQLIYSEPLGRAAGYDAPQYSIHRGDLHGALFDAFVARVGADRVVLDACVDAVEQGAAGVTIHLRADGSGAARAPVRADVAVACDGIHSVLRRQLHPDEGPPKYTGYNMWRGVTPHPPILNGATMIRAGWLATGKMVIYPVRPRIDDAGRQLVNWVAEIETPQPAADRDWNRRGRLEDFLPAFADWRFDWLDVPALITGAESVLEFPMVDQDPLPWWTAGRVTLMGDAAHPMVPRGSNGAGQAILDAICLADLLAASDDWPAALAAYEAERLPATARVVLTNRVAPPDVVLKEVYERTGDRPFDDIDKVISRAELAELQNAYKRIAGYDLETLKRQAAARA